MRDTVIFAAPRPPWPLDTAAAVRAQRLATGLARAFDVVVATLGRSASAADRHPDERFEEALEGVEVIVVPGLERLEARPGRVVEAASLVRRHSLTWAPYRLPAFANAVRAIAARRGARIVHFADPAAALGGAVSGAINVLAAEELEHRAIAALSDGATLRRRAVNAREWRRVRRDERAVWRSMDLCLALSEPDARAMRAGGAPRVEICSAGIDPVEPLPPPRRAPGDPVWLVCPGAGGHDAGARGVAWLVGDVLPRVRRELPVGLELVGRPPAGHPDEPRRSYGAAHVAVVPMLEGWGAAQPALEAMAHGRPVVSTSAGLEALPDAAAALCHRADDPAAFAEAIVHAARACEPGHPLLGARLARAHEAVRQAFWPRVVDRLVDCYRAALDEADTARWPDATAALAG